MSTSIRTHDLGNSRISLIHLDPHQNSWDVVSNSDSYPVTFFLTGSLTHVLDGLLIKNVSYLIHSYILDPYSFGTTVVVTPWVSTVHRKRLRPSPFVVVSLVTLSCKDMDLSRVMYPVYLFVRYLRTLQSSESKNFFFVDGILSLPIWYLSG